MKRILVVDDEVSIRVLLSTFLDKEYEVITKNDGTDALAWLQEGKMPDLIITDIDMPNINGMELVQNVRASGFFKDIPVIMLSSNETSNDRINALKIGADDYLVKPFNPEELKLRIENIISKVKAF